MNYSKDIKGWRKITVYDTDFRYCLLDMADTITRLKLWNWFKNQQNPKSGYNFWNHKNIQKISNNLKNNNHSGATFGYCIKQMHLISKNGFEKWNSNDMPC
tara:strand:- start:1889 stop:2191 length:303 start_codon:yes stop_codon:yes gene_type:complete